MLKIGTTAFELWNGRAVVRGGAGGALAPPEFVVLENRAEREIDSLLISAPLDLKT